MKNLVPYRIISYILLFIAAFLSMAVFTSMIGALANPVALLPLFLVACIIIYTYCSWRFLVRGIDRDMPCSNTLRDLIRINGYITLVLAGMGLFQMIVIMANPEMIELVIEQARAAQPAGREMSEDMLRQMTKYTLAFLLGYTLLLVLHSIISLRLLKQYQYLFEPPADK